MSMAHSIIGRFRIVFNTLHQVIKIFAIKSTFKECYIAFITVLGTLYDFLGNMHLYLQYWINLPNIVFYLR